MGQESIYFLSPGILKIKDNNIQSFVKKPITIHLLASHHENILDVLVKGWIKYSGHLIGGSYKKQWHLVKEKDMIS